MKTPALPTAAELLRRAFVPKMSILILTHVTVGIRGLADTTPALLYVQGRDGRNVGVLFSLS